MKIAVSATDRGPGVPVDSRFGRASCFMVWDSESEEWQALDNSPNLSAAQGAGIQTAEMLSRSGVGAVLTGHCGPKAFRVLEAAGIEVYTDATGTVSDALAAYQNGQLSLATAPDVEGHW